MTDQHIVELEGVRITRLPAGRAEGFVWLTFVGSGEALRFGRDPEEHWRISNHVSAAWPDGSLAKVVGSGASGADGISSFEITIRDTGESSLALTYTDDGDVIDQEVVSIPS